MIFRFLAALVATLVFAAGARAAVVYDFEGLAGDSPLSFSLVADDFIGVDTAFAPSDLAACSSALGACSGVRFVIDAIDFNGAGESALLFESDGLLTTVFYFEQGVFSREGLFSTTTTFNPGSLQVALAPAVPVPEPGTVASMLAGLAVLAAVRRRGAQRPSSKSFSR